MKQFPQMVLLAATAFAANTAWAEWVVAVSAQNPVNMLTQQQVADIYLARVAGFPDGALALPVDLPAGTAVRKDFYRQVLHMNHRQLRQYWTRLLRQGGGQPPKEIGTETDVKTLIADNPNIIGYLDRSQVDSRVKVVFSLPN